MGPGTGLVNYGLFRPELGGGTRENIHKVSFCLSPVSAAYIYMYGKLQQLAAATPSNQPLTLAGWNNNAQIAGQCTEMWPQQTCRGCFLDDVQCDHQYGECNTQRRGLKEKATVAAKYSTVRTSSDVAYTSSGPNT